MIVPTERAVARVQIIHIYNIQNTQYIIYPEDFFRTKIRLLTTGACAWITKTITTKHIVDKHREAIAVRNRLHIQ